mgnify:FL=1
MTPVLLILAALGLTVVVALWCALAAGSADDDDWGRDG